MKGVIAQGTWLFQTINSTNNNLEKLNNSQKQIYKYFSLLKWAKHIEIQNLLAEKSLRNILAESTFVLGWNLLS